jgi:hypothetical protein
MADNRVTAYLLISPGAFVLAARRGHHPVNSTAAALIGNGSSLGKPRREEPPMANKADLERRWADAWNDLFDIVGKRKDIRCRLPDGTIVDVEGCQGWLQEQAYDDWHVAVQRSKFGDRLEVVASRWRADEVHGPQQEAGVARKGRKPM